MTEQTKWRQYATEDELAKASILESAMAENRHTSERLASQLRRIRNRCLQRAVRAAEQKERK
jgi:hypothetical protein